MKPRERVLLTAFIALFLVIAGGGALAFAAKFLQAVSEENAGLGRRVAEMKAALGEGARWEERSVWLEKNIPSIGSAEEASALLLESVQAEATKAGLAIAAKELMQTQKGADGTKAEGYFDKSTVKLTFSAVSEEVLFAWMHGLQQPEKFLGVTSLQITPMSEGRTVSCEAQVTLFYRETSSPRKIVKAP